ncbi:MAG: hypothetical protein ACTHK7_02070, partial [Aureliella sp.]
MNAASTKRLSLRSQMAILAVVAIALCLGAGFWSPRDFFIAYLAAVMLPWSISVGSITLGLIFGLTGGRWGRAAWPWLVTFSKMMPLVALLFIPWLLSISLIYPWFGGAIFSSFENTQNRQWYYQTPFFVGRTVVYFVTWIVLSWWPSLIAMRGGEAVAGFGLIAILLSVTWATIDWVMSFDPFFTSSLLGVWIGGGAMLVALSAAVAGVCFGGRIQPENKADEKTLADLSSLLLAMLLLWAYYSFAQFLIMWSGDLPDEVDFYVIRTRSWWAILTPALAVLGFVVPFLCMLSYRFKRTPSMIGSLAIALIGVRALELAWIVLPGADERAMGLRFL